MPFSVSALVDSQWIELSMKVKLMWYTMLIGFNIVCLSVLFNWVPAAST